jgi:hypothetical protein
MLSPDRQAIAKRYPRLIAHLMCESLGYMSVETAVVTIIRWQEGSGLSCEWFAHIAFHGANAKRFEGMDYMDRMRVVTRETLQSAIKRRHFHKGYMADISVGRRAVAKAVGMEPRDSLDSLAGWF